MTAQSATRALRPTHLVALRAFDNRASCTEITAPAWPRAVDGHERLPLWSLLSHSMAHPAGYRLAWVHVGENGIDGLTVARERCGGLVWDVRHLWADSERQGVAQELLERVCEEAAARGGRRVFLETSPRPWEMEIAQRAGFEHYTRSTLYLHHGGAAPSVAPLAAARPRAREDEYRLFQLYRAAVPAPVRAAEALTLEEWLALHKGTKRWAPGLLANRAQHVWEEDDSLFAWMELATEARSQHVEWLVHPSYDAACDGLVAFALDQAGGKLPLYATCREYQQPLESALERAGFARAAERAVYVRQLAVRVPERRPVAARARATRRVSTGW